MQYNRLGTSGLQVSRFCIGTAFRSSLFSSDFDESGCVRTIHQVGFDLKVLAQELHREGVVGMNSAHFCSCDDNSLWLFLCQKRKNSFAVK